VEKLKAPFPWFGGKSTVADVVWSAFGDVQTYIEPFAGSLAVLLAKPASPDRTEIVNDKDLFITNFWRAVSFDTEGVAKHANWPPNECDKHARAYWLLTEGTKMLEAVLAKPEGFDAKIAGWWYWVICANIAPIMVEKGSWYVDGDNGWKRLDRSTGTTQCGQGFSEVTDSRVGIAKSKLGFPHKGVFRVSLFRRACEIAEIEDDQFVTNESSQKAILEGLRKLRDRLRWTAVYNGDWSRVVSNSCTKKRTPTGVFLDPPYDARVGRDRDVYFEDSDGLSGRVRQWCIENGDRPEMRIALCGYEGEHDMPDSWFCYKWKANGGMANMGEHRKGNKYRERIWFSPHCLPIEQLVSGPMAEAIR
jgi:site-specific DNA-adenine methylase